MSNKSDFVLIPKGTTAQRPDPAQTGMLRYNTTVPQYEIYDGTSWVELGEQPPQFVSVSPNTLAADATEAGSTQNLVISGGNFKSGAQVTLLYSGSTANGNQSGQVTATSVSVDNPTQITATFSTAQINGNHVTDLNTYDLKIANPSNLSVIAANTVFVDSQPTWTLANGTTLRTVIALARTGLSIPITTATDPDGDAVTYSATSLPTGLTINSTTGTITGDLANVTVDTTNTFSVVANSTGSFSGATQKSTTRSVNIVRKFGLSNSLLFDGSSYLTRTPTVTGNRTRYTVSTWLKLMASPNSENRRAFFSASPSSGGNNSNTYQMGFMANTSNQFQTGVHTIYIHNSTARYDDSSAWYHFVISVDTGNSTTAYKARVYVNGEEMTSFSVDNRSSGDFASTGINLANNPHYIGCTTPGYMVYTGYLADMYFIDGQALTPTSFGESINSIWTPKLYNPGNDALTDYGTNGFHLTFAPSTIPTNTNTVQDVSGRNNHWTASGF